MSSSQTSSRSASGWTSVPVLTGAGLAALALADQFALGWTRQAVTAHYEPIGQHPDPNLLTMVLVMVGLVFAVWMALVARLARGGRRTWVVLGVVAAAVVWAGLAALASSAYEFNGYDLPAVWRVLPWVLPVIALVDLFRPRPARQA